MNEAPLPAPTERLRFAQFHPDEAPYFLDLNAHPDAIRFTGDPPFADVEAARRFLVAYDQYERFGMGRWSLYLRSTNTNTFVGWCGLKTSPERDDEVDLGFRLHPRYWGRGLATEAARACLEHGFTTLGLRRIVGRAQDKNVASHRVLHKVGMRLAGSFEEHGERWRVYVARP